MRRSGHPSRPRAITCCFFASLKTLLISTKAICLTPKSTSRASFSLAGFQVTIIGRFWVTAGAVYVSNPFPTSHSPCNRASLNPEDQQGSADWVAPAAPITGYIADLERRECEGGTIATSSYNPQDNPGTL